MDNSQETMQPQKVFPTQNKANPWHLIDYAHTAPDDFVIPEGHWPGFDIEGLDRGQRVRLNQLATVFMCEMFVHFEEYIVRFVERHKPRLTAHIREDKLDRFIEEEVDHINAFYALLKLFRPDEYPTSCLRMLKWSSADDFLVKTASIPAFFFTAALFEEMTLYVVDVMNEDPTQSFAPVHSVMELHAKEEKSHVGIDNHLLRQTARERPRIVFLSQIALSLPIIVYSNLALTRSWNRQARDFGRREGLSRAQTRRIAKRGLSSSDKLGLENFFRKQRKLAVPGGRAMSRLLELFTL